MAVWPNGSRTRPKLSSLWKQYSGQPAPDHFGLDSYGYKYNCAIEAGVISKIGWNTYGGGGREIYLRLDNGDVILYYHNAIAALVRVGQRVVAGQRLGVQSSTGKTYGIHLHIEVWKGGYRSRRVNPLPYITALVGSSTAGGTTLPIIEGNPVKRIYKTTTGTNNAPLWALGDDEALDPLNAGWVETRDTNVVSGQWAPRYGSFVGLTETAFVAMRTKFRAPRVNTGTSITDAQLDALAVKIAAKLPTPAQIAEAVNDDAAKRLQN